MTIRLNKPEAAVESSPVLLFMFYDVFVSNSKSFNTRTNLACPPANVINISCMIHPSKFATKLHFITVYGDVCADLRQRYKGLPGRFLRTNSKQIKFKTPQDLVEPITIKGCHPIRQY